VPDQTHDIVRASVPSGARSLAFDFPGLRVGCAEYPDAPTGVTVFHFPGRVLAAVDTRGGSPATTLTDNLRAAYGKYVPAIVFTGGSAYGLAAASGVASRLLDSARAGTCWEDIAIVPGAAVFDFGERENSIYPDGRLGSLALDSTREGWFPLGAHGAGSFVHCGKLLGREYGERAGQGAAVGRLGRTKVAVFTVVNSVGAIVDRSGRVVLGNRDAQTGTRYTVEDTMRLAADRGRPAGLDESGNTTLTLVVIDRDMSQCALQRLAIEVHTSMARAIQPFHTARDGDTLFAVTTGEDCTSDPDHGELSLYASELAWSAVLQCVPSVR
jgi:L-aminopeptidase/D-esterase-like protein